MHRRGGERIAHLRIALDVERWRAECAFAAEAETALPAPLAPERKVSRAEMDLGLPRIGSKSTRTAGSRFCRWLSAAVCSGEGAVFVARVPTRPSMFGSCFAAGGRTQKPRSARMRIAPESARQGGRRVVILTSVPVVVWVSGFQRCFKPAWFYPQRRPHQEMRQEK